jgi:EAL and modified HD-GYP domain-containing signal transduction protein
MDIPMTQVVASIPLTEEVIGALTEHKGQIGLVLKTVLAIEQGDWEQVINSGIQSSILRSIYFESIKWAHILTEEVYGQSVNS